MRSLSIFAVVTLAIVLGFGAGWVARDAYKPTVHVVIDDIPFMSGSSLPKQSRGSDCGTPEECYKAMNCEVSAFIDPKTAQANISEGM